ncbi:MAG: response regulator [Paludibacter sp.]|jgi:CheY-like chemotaxis protein|nr:response regulator [Paludibacter sp.]
MENIKELVILIAEDDDGHAELIQSGLVESGVRNKIIRFSNGEDAWNFLYASKKQKDSKYYLLLLDIHMPQMDGVEVLRLIKSDPKLKEMPVIILTTTDDPREIEECYQIGCNIYITKPVEFVKFAETLNHLGLFLQIIKV